MEDYERMKKIIDEIDLLISNRVTESNPRFQTWHTNAERFLLKRYGDKSLELSKFQKTQFAPSLWRSSSDLIETCKNSLMTTKLTFEMYLEEMQEERECKPKEQHTVAFDKVFIVHGHDGGLKEAVARAIENQKIEAIILSEKENQGRTIIEKIEDYGDVGAAICLFTADDVGNEKTEGNSKPRARQNVVFEAGYFMGRLGRARTVILAEKGIEIPSDLSGVVYTDTSNWEFQLLKELYAIGYQVDMNRLL